MEKGGNDAKEVPSHERSNINSEDLILSDESLHYPEQAQADDSSETILSGLILRSSVPTTDEKKDTQEHCVTVGRKTLDLLDSLKDLFINKLSTNIHDLKEIIHNYFLDSFDKSPTNTNLEKQIPFFVLEIMAQKCESELFHMLESQTPYCDIFNFFNFIEKITDKIDSEEVKKKVSCCKDALYCMKMDDILPYVDNKEHLEKKGFSKVVLRMTENFKLLTYEGMHQHKNLISVILKLQNLVCFVGFDERHRTVTYLIPSILIEGVCSSVRQVADRFHINSILDITIGGQKISNVQCSILQQSLPSSMKIEVFICLKIRALSIVVDVNFSDSIQVVKWRIYKKLYIPPDMQVLRYHDKNLENDKTLQYYKIEISSTIYLMPEVEKIYHDVIELLPSNCQSVVRQWDQEIKHIFELLSIKHDDCVSLYMHLLPYVYEKCSCHVLRFIDQVINAIKNCDKKEKLQELRIAIMQLEDKELNQSSMFEESASAMTKTKEVTIPITKAPITVTYIKTKLEIGQSDEHRTPCMSHLTEVTKVKDVNSTTTQLEDKTNTITDLNHKELNQSSMLEESASAMPKPNEVTMHITKAPATVTDMQTKLEIGQSDKHHTPCMSHLTEVTEVKDINSTSRLLTSLTTDSSLPDKLVSNEDFIEIKIHYHDILHLMPDNYHQTLYKLQPVITGDETAEILEIDNPDIANKKILHCLIQKMKSREHMLDFCEHLDKVITSQDLKTIVDEIKTGVQQGMRSNTQSLTASIHQNNLSSPVFKYPVLQPPHLPFNLVHRQEQLDAIVSKLCNTTTNQNAHSKVIAVTGVGGFGKTTLVIELCYDPRVQRQFTGGVLFIDLGPQTTNPNVKLKEIYFSIVGESLENYNNVETEIGKIFKDTFHNFLVIIDDVCDTEDVKPIIAAFKCHVVFTTRRNDIAQNLAVPENTVIVGPMKLNEAITLLTDDLLHFDKISSDDKGLLKELAQDAHMWPILLCLVRGQLNHHLKLNIHVSKAIINVQKQLRDRGLTAFDKRNIESVNKAHKPVSIYIESTLELLPEEVLNRFITLILFTGIGGIFSEAALPNLWNSSDLEAKEVVTTLFDYGLVSFKNIATLQCLIHQVVVHTHSVISQYMFDNIRSDQVATLSPFALFCTNKSVGGKLESLFRNSYLQQDLSQLTPREYLTYTKLKIEHVVIPFQLKRITAHILHDPHVILLMLQRIHNTIRKSVNHIQIITQFSERLVALDGRCKKALKDAQVLNRIINSEVQHFVFMRDYDKLKKSLEEHCMAFSNETIAQDCIELIYQIIPMCEDSISENFDFVRQMLETMTPQYHFNTMEKLPIIKLYIGLHRDIVSSLKIGSTELYKMYTYTTSGDFIKKLESVSSNYSSKLKEISPAVISNLSAMLKK